MTKRTKPSTHRLLPLVALLVVSCGDSANVIGPGNQLEVTNATDSFQWQVTALVNVTQVLDYSWVNTGATADVNQSSALGGGTATLEVRDAGGAIVYTGSLAQDGTFTTSAGSPGTWTVTVSLRQAQGTLNFRLQKP